MITFKQHLSESLSSSYPVDIYQLSERGCEFYFKDKDGTLYHVELDRLIRPNGIGLAIDFKAKIAGNNTYTMGITGRSSNALKVYSTIGNQVRKYIKQYPVDKILYVAASERTFNAYALLAKRIASELNGTINKAEEGVVVITLPELTK